MHSWFPVEVGWYYLHMIVLGRWKSMGIGLDLYMKPKI